MHLLFVALIYFWLYIIPTAFWLDRQHSSKYINLKKKSKCTSRREKKKSRSINTILLSTKNNQKPSLKNTNAINQISVTRNFSNVSDVCFVWYSVEKDCLRVRLFVFVCVCACVCTFVILIQKNEKRYPA